MKSGTRKKIAVVIPKYGLLGGAEGLAAELTGRIAETGQYDVHVFANRWTGQDGDQSRRIAFHKVPVLSFPKFLTTISFAYFVGLKTAQTPFDIVHTHERIFGADLFTMHGIPHRLWVRDVRKKRLPSLFDYGTMQVERKLAANCPRFVAVSNLTREKFLEEYPEAGPDRVTVIHPGVDVDAYAGLDRAACRSEVRRQYGIGENDLVVIFVSMNYDIKGLDYLMLGLGAFRKKHREERFRLMIVGKSDNRKYVALAQQAGIAEQVIYTGAVPREGLGRLYLAADIFAMPSRFDTFGLTVLEAMAASLPVIVSTHVGAKDLVKPKVNGLIVDTAGQQEGIAAAMEWLLNRDTRMKVSGEAFRTARQHRWEAVRDRYLEVYWQILTASPS